MVKEINVKKGSPGRGARRGHALEPAEGYVLVDRWGVIGVAAYGEVVLGEPQGRVVLYAAEDALPVPLAEVCDAHRLEVVPEECIALVYVSPRLAPPRIPAPGSRVKLARSDDPWHKGLIGEPGTVLAPPMGAGNSGSLDPLVTVRLEVDVCATPYDYARTQGRPTRGLPERGWAFRASQLEVVTSVRDLLSLK